MSDPKNILITDDPKNILITDKYIIYRILSLLSEKISPLSKYRDFPTDTYFTLTLDHMGISFYIDDLSEIVIIYNDPCWLNRSNSNYKISLKYKTCQIVYFAETDINNLVIRFGDIDYFMNIIDSPKINKKSNNKKNKSKVSRERALEILNDPMIREVTRDDNYADPATKLFDKCSGKKL